MLDQTICDRPISRHLHQSCSCMVYPSYLPSNCTTEDPSNKRSHMLGLPPLELKEAAIFEMHKLNCLMVGNTSLSYDQPRELSQRHVECDQQQCSYVQAPNKPLWWIIYCHARIQLAPRPWIHSLILILIHYRALPIPGIAFTSPRTCLLTE